MVKIIGKSIYCKRAIQTANELKTSIIYCPVFLVVSSTVMIS